jgi:hypothetical protein
MWEERFSAPKKPLLKRCALALAPPTYAIFECHPFPFFVLCALLRSSHQCKYSLHDEGAIMSVCDACGAELTDEHVRARIERLEFSTRNRPIRIQVLFIDASPPARPEDFFYRPVIDRSIRSVASRMFFDEMAKAVGIPPGRDLKEQSVLTEFQRRNYFLAYAVECPVESLADQEAAVRRLAPTIQKRVQTSYKPKYIFPLSQPTTDLVSLFQLIGWADRVVLDKGGPFIDPFLGDPQNQAEFGTNLGDRLHEALLRLT